jgi:cytochrome c-type biogenesis protein CcsB
MIRMKSLRLLACVLVALAGAALAQPGQTTSPLAGIKAPTLDVTTDTDTLVAQPDIDPATLHDSGLEKVVAASGIGRIAVQNEGVVTSLRTCAEILVHEVTGRSSFRRQDPLFTVLSMAYRNRDWMRVAMLPIESPRLATLLGLDPAKKHRVSAQWVMQTPRARDFVLGGMTGDGTDPMASLDKQTQAALGSLRARFDALVAMPSELRILPLPDGSGYWISPLEMLHPDRAESPELGRRIAGIDQKAPGVAAIFGLHLALQAAFERGGSEGLLPAVEVFRSAWIGNPDYAPAYQVSLDYLNATIRPFQKTSYAYFLSFIAFLVYLYTARRRGALSSLDEPAPATETLGDAIIHTEPGFGDPALAAEMEQRPGSRRVWGISFTLLCVSALILAAALTIRYVLSGHMPLSNMYESITFSMGAFALVGLVFEAVYRTGWIGAVTSLLGMVLMTVANSLPLQMRKVEPLVAVLNSVWLTWHVATLLVSYAAFMLSFLFCVAWFWKDMTGNRPGLLPRKEFFDYLCYRAVQVGWPLLTIGVVLGAVWADTAWGNPWSWDPKETWALITWLMYTIYLHLRLNLGWQGRSTIVAAMLGFLMVLITYFGVTYLPGIAGGLHSYAK